MSDCETFLACYAISPILHGFPAERACVWILRRLKGLRLFYAGDDGVHDRRTEGTLFQGFHAFDRGAAR